MQIPLAQDGLDEIEIEAITKIFRAGNLTMGKHVREFELDFARKLGVQHAIMVNSGSSANLLALEMLANHIGKKKLQTRGDYYIAVPAVLWPTSIWPIVQLGFRALVIDTREDSLEIDIDLLVAAKADFGDQLVGAVLIHPLGKALNLTKVNDLRVKHGMFIIEDTCESLGAGNSGEFAGSVGNVGTFSFYYSHHITTVEGGMVVTNSDSDANRLLSMRAHGWTRNRLDRVEIESKYSDFNKDFLFVTSGYNFRPMEFQGALGVSQLKKLDNFIVARVSNVLRVVGVLKNSNFRVIGSDFEATDIVEQRDQNLHPVPHSWMAIPIAYKGQRMTLAEIHKFLNSNGIATRPILAGNFMSQPAAEDEMISVFQGTNNADDIYRRSFMIGNHHNFTEEQLFHLLAVLEKIILVDEQK